jgi:phosphatidylglycerophosphatase A
MMLPLAKMIATVGGIGYIKKGSGTVAALVMCVIWYFLFRNYNPDNWITVVGIVALFILGVWSASAVEKIWGKDSSRVVIDEIAGMCVSLVFIPFCFKYILIGFILFRFFDITKPLFIRKSEVLPGGWGVMADDLLAGIFSNLILQVIARFNLC